MKRIMGTLLSLCMVLSLLPVSAYAEEPVLVKGEIGNYIVLNENCNLSTSLLIDDGEDHVLDLNGFTLVSEGGITVKNGSRLVIKDGRGGGEFYFSGGGCLTVRGFEGEVEGDFIDGSVDYSRTKKVKSEVEIEGGSLYSEGRSAVEVRGCGAALSVKGGRIVNRGNESVEPAAVRTFREKNDGGVSLKITGGEIICDNGTGLFLESGGDYLISSGEINGRSGICLFSGSLSVKGNSLISGGGSSEDGKEGAALSVVSAFMGDYYGETEVEIEGGTFISEQAPAVSEWNTDPDAEPFSSALSVFRIRDGRFSGFEADVYSESRSRFISGGLFAHNPSAMIISGASCTESDSGVYPFKVTLDGEENSPGEDDYNIGFSDVGSDDYFYEAVVWAVKNGITEGISKSLFMPAKVCTRAEAVTFLWRLAGEPLTGTNSFYDVKLSDYFHDAVTWAGDCGITRGMDEGRFCPEEKVTRGQFMTFLMRYAEFVDGKKVSLARKNVFTDIKRGDYYFEAVLWALSEGIAFGRSASEFAPDDCCTRGETVTFLQRYSC